MAEKLVSIKITSAVAIAGVIMRPGKVVTVSEADAKNLLHRGRADLAGEVAEKPLSKMNVEELKALAADLEIEDFDGMNKARLLVAIGEAQSE